jgi:hypothetical protein
MNRDWYLRNKAQWEESWREDYEKNVEILNRELELSLTADDLFNIEMWFDAHNADLSAMRSWYETEVTVKHPARETLSVTAVLEKAKDTIPGYCPMCGKELTKKPFDTDGGWCKCPKHGEICIEYYNPKEMKVDGEN